MTGLVLHAGRPANPTLSSDENPPITGGLAMSIVLLALAAVGWAEVARNSKPLAVSLKPGAVVSGQVVAPSRGDAAIRAVLRPRFECGDDRNNIIDPKTEMIGSLLAAVAPDGTVRFDHVRRGDAPIATGRVILKGTETARIDLATDPGHGP
jgi:hypothetical protein